MAFVTAMFEFTRSSFTPEAQFKEQTKTSDFVIESKIKRWFSELPLLAKTGGDPLDQSLHLQRDQPGWFPNAR